MNGNLLNKESKLSNKKIKNKNVDLSDKSSDDSDKDSKNIDSDFDDIESQEDSDKNIDSDNTETDNNIDENNSENDESVDNGDNISEEDGKSLYGKKSKIYNIDEDDDTISKEYVYVSNELRESKPFMTKYEITILLETRVEQLVRGAKPVIDIRSKFNLNNLQKNEILEIAVNELNSGIFPLFIERDMPGNKKEKWLVKEFVNLNTLLKKII